VHETLPEIIQGAAVEQNGRLTLACGAAFRIARETGATLDQIGQYCNDHHIKIAHCQLGCFP